MNQKPNIISSFFRYNVVALSATALDFGLFVLLHDLLNVWYVLSTFVSSVSGGILAFILNRSWVFAAKDGNVKKQAIKYLLVWMGSIFLNTYGLYLVVEYWGISPLPSKVFVAIIVGVGYNFLMSKFLIFK